MDEQEYVTFSLDYGTSDNRRKKARGRKLDSVTDRFDLDELAVALSNTIRGLAQDSALLEQEGEYAVFPDDLNLTISAADAGVVEVVITTPNGVSSEDLEDFVSPATNFVQVVTTEHVVVVEERVEGSINSDLVNNAAVAAAQAAIAACEAVVAICETEWAVANEISASADLTSDCTALQVAEIDPTADGFSADYLTFVAKNAASAAQDMDTTNGLITTAAFGDATVLTSEAYTAASNAQLAALYAADSGGGSYGSGGGAYDDVISKATTAIDSAALVSAQIEDGSSYKTDLDAATADAGAVLATATDSYDDLVAVQGAAEEPPTVSTAVITTQLVTVSPSPPSPSVPTLGGSDTAGDINEGTESAITTSSSDNSWVAAVVVCLFLFVVVPIGVYMYARSRYPGQEGTWLKLKVTHSNPSIPFLYMNKEVRDQLEKEVRSSSAVLRGSTAEATLTKGESNDDDDTGAERL